MEEEEGDAQSQRARRDGVEKDGTIFNSDGRRGGSKRAAPLQLKKSSLTVRRAGSRWDEN